MTIRISWSLNVFFQPTIESGKIDGSGVLEFERWMRILHPKWVGEDEPTARSKHRGSDGKKILNELSKVGDGNPFSHGRIGDDQSGGIGPQAFDCCKVAKIAADKF